MARSKRRGALVSVLAVASLWLPVAVVSAGPAAAVPDPAGPAAASKPAQRSSPAVAPALAAAQRRTLARWQVIQKIQDTVGRHPGAYAGLSAHGDRRITIHLAKGQQAPAGEIGAARRAAAAVGIAVSVDRQNNSFAALTALANSIPKARPFAALGRNLSTWGVDPATNSVEVGVVHLTPRIAATMRALYGGKVTLVQRPRATPVLGRFADTAPYWGGDRIRDPADTAECSSGFTMTNLYGVRFVITAGHCYPSGETVDTPSGAGMGTVDYRRYGSGNLDNELIGGSTYQGFIYTGDINSHAAEIVHSAANSCYQCQVYFDGSVTGQSLATIVSPGPYCEIATDGQQSCGLIEAVSAGGNDICNFGDSGGPVYAYDGHGGVTAVGIIHGRYGPEDCNFTEVPAILSYWQSTISSG